MVDRVVGTTLPSLVQGCLPNWGEETFPITEVGHGPKKIIKLGQREVQPVQKENYRFAKERLGRKPGEGDP